jgi:hypothetical protein
VVGDCWHAYHDEIFTPRWREPYLSLQVAQSPRISRKPPIARARLVDTMNRQRLWPGQDVEYTSRSPRGREDVRDVGNTTASLWRFLPPSI